MEIHAVSVINTLTRNGGMQRARTHEQVPGAIGWMRSFLSMALRSAIAAVVCGLSVSAYSAAGSSNHLDIPAGDLSSALDLLARQMHVEVIYSADDVKGLYTRGVHGDLTPGDAVRELLEGSDLTTLVHSSGAILITRNGASGNSSDPPRTRVKSPDSAARQVPETYQAPALEGVVVNATRRDELLGNVGVGITLVSGNELEARSASNIEDFVALVPGLNIQSYGTAGFGVASIRGISPQSSGATLATYVDDVPLGGASAISANAWYWPDVDPADLERVEVLKGPQGTLYGASSLGGVIKYVTRTPSLTATEVSTSEDLNGIQAGAPGTKFRASVSTPIIENELALRISGYYEYIGGYIDDVGIGGNDTNHGYKSGMRVTLLYQPLDVFKIRLNANFQSSQVHGYDITDDNGPTFQPLYGYFVQRRYTRESFKVETQIYSADVQWDTDLGSLISATSYSVFKPRQSEDLTIDAADFPPGVVSTTNPAGSIGRYYDEQRTQEIRFTSKRLGLFEFVAGTFYQHEGLEQTSGDYTYGATGQVNPEAFLGGYATSGTLDEYAGFGDATIYLAPEVDATVGYRYSDIQQQVNQQIAGNLFGFPGAVDVYPVVDFAQVSQTYLAGIRWRMTGQVMFYVRAATGYRPGGTRAILPGAPAGFGDTYSSDSIHSYEAGVKVWALDGRLTLSTDSYVINWTKIQTLVYIGSLDTQGNAGAARSKGAEFEAVYVPMEGLTVGANTAYTNARFTETSAEADVTSGERLHYVPTWTLTAYVDYTVPLSGPWKPQVGGDYVYRSSQLDLTGIALPGYTTFGVHAGVQFRRQSLRLYVKNLTNDRGIVGTNQGYSAGTPYGVDYAQPRTFGVIFSQRF